MNHLPLYFNKTWLLVFELIIAGLNWEVYIDIFLNTNIIIEQYTNLSHSENLYFYTLNSQISEFKGPSCPTKMFLSCTKDWENELNYCNNAYWNKVSRAVECITDLSIIDSADCGECVCSMMLNLKIRSYPVSLVLIKPTTP